MVLFQYQLPIFQRSFDTKEAILCWNQQSMCNIRYGEKCLFFRKFSSFLCACSTWKICRKHHFTINFFIRLSHNKKKLNQWRTSFPRVPGCNVTTQNFERIPIALERIECFTVRRIHVWIVGTINNYGQTFTISETTILGWKAKKWSRKLYFLSLANWWIWYWNILEN